MRIRSATVAAVALVSASLLGSAATVHAATPGDPFYGNQWGLTKVNAPTAWDTATGAGVTIAVVDSGIDLNHDDLRGDKLVLVGGSDLVRGDSQPDDEHSHGTHVSGIASARTNNGIGIAGTAPDARIMPIKVLDNDGRGTSTNVDAGIRLAVANGAKVINLSLGSDLQGFTGASFVSACNDAFARGALCVVAAGNSYITGSGVQNDNLLVVTATNPDDGKPTYASNVGSAKWAMAAPGGGDALFTPSGVRDQRIYSTVRFNGYGYKAGTSMAAPFVSGAAAILFELGLNNQQVVDRLLSTAKNIGSSSTFGAGRLDVAAAVSGLSRAAPAPTPTSTTTTSTSTSTTTTSTTSSTSTTTPGQTTTTTQPQPTTSTTEPGDSPPSGGSDPGSPAPDSVNRLAGADRMATAIAISQEQFGTGTANAVVLARADTFPDALGGTPLAVKAGGPLLLTARDSLDDRTRDEIRRVLPAGATVHLLGGEVALTATVEGAIRGLGYRTVRYAGADRFETATKIATAGLGDPQTLLLANGLDYPDALVAGAAAPNVGGAVLLTAGSSLPRATAEHVAARQGSSRYAVGRLAAQADPGATPLAGADAVETSRRVAEVLLPDATSIGLASAATFADALGGGAHIARRAGPLLLTDPRQLSPVVEDYLRAKRDRVARGFAYGGTVALSQAVQDAATAAIR